MNVIPSAFDRIRDQFDCEHEEQQPTRFQNSNGVINVVMQCTRCGKHCGARKKADFDTEKLPWFDRALQNRWNQELSRAWEHARERQLQEIEEQRDLESQIWWDAYTEYIASSRWRALRNLVLKRDNHVCQGCLTPRAEVVHHLSYAMYNQTGHSMAYECVSLCHKCHAAIHPHLCEPESIL